ncbi:MAG: hypothetical protein Q8S84_02355 [bacterium]|nr:hypothetical protein [bacterium]MDP3380394.1 hypothetical protein [bacterium]
MDMSAKLELYQGKKYAIAVAKNNINIHNINLKLITFQTIFDELSLSLVISLIVIAYNHKSAKKTNIHI